MSYPIETGIPVPDLPGNRRQPTYPFADLEVGQSFFVPDAPDVTLRLSQSRVHAATNVANRRQIGKKFTARSIQGGVRVWRIA